MVMQNAFWEFKLDRFAGSLIKCVKSSTIHSMSAEIDAIKQKQLLSELNSLRQQVSEMKAREKLDKQAGELLHIFQINSPIGLFVLQDGKFVFANKQFQNVLGFDLTELKGSYSLDRVHPEDKATVRDKAVEMLKGELKTPYIYRIISKGKQIRWVQEGVVSVQYRGRRATLGHSMDITDSVKTEVKLRKLYENEKSLRKKLEDEVNKRIEFTRALVHELKTPLTPILFSSELLADEISEQPLKSIAQNIRRGASNLNNRIDELLDLARVEIGSLKLHLKPVNPERLIGNVASDSAALFQRYNQHLVVNIADRFPEILADEERLHQIILNLLVNASKFTPEGGTITLSSGIAKNSFLLEVKDNGIGIPKKDQKRIFEAYQRHSADRERFSGLGLGLALCKRLVELHGGRIWVESRLGKGSTFSVSLPLTPPDMTQQNGQEEESGETSDN